MSGNAAVVIIFLLLRDGGLDSLLSSDYIRLFDSVMDLEIADLDIIAKRLHHAAEMIEKISKISSFSSIISSFGALSDEESSVSDLIPLISGLLKNDD